MRFFAALTLAWGAATIVIPAALAVGLVARAAWARAATRVYGVILAAVALAGGFTTAWLGLYAAALILLLAGRRGEGP